MSIDAYTLYQLSKLRQADLQAAANADRIAELLPRHVRPELSVYLADIALALLRPTSPRLAI